MQFTKQPTGRERKDLHGRNTIEKYNYEKNQKNNKNTKLTYVTLHSPHRAVL